MANLAKHFPIAQIALKLVAALICSVLLWELVLECLVARSPGMWDHPSLGRSLAPGLYVNGQEGFCATRINSLGMRNRELGPKQAAGHRILVLGDSHTAGLQVEDSKTYCALTEQNLRLSHGAGIEVVNGGRDGANAAYYIHLAEAYKTLVQPDIVVVELNERAFTFGSLKTNAYYNLVPVEGGFTTVENMGQPSPDPITRRFPRLAAWTRLSTVRLASERYSAFRSGRTGEQDHFARAHNMTTQAGDALEWSVAQLHRCYPRLLLVYIPDIDYDRPYAAHSAVDAVLARSADRFGIPVLNMRTDFMAAYHATHQPARGFNNTRPGFGHMNELGHALTAARLTRALAAQLSR